MVLILFLVFQSLAIAHPLTVPPAPLHYILDEPQALDRLSRQTLESLVIEHDHLSGEQFMIALFKSCQSIGSEWGQEVFNQWKVGKREKDNGILLTLCADTREAFIHTGTGIDSILDTGSVQELLTESILPEMAKGNFQNATVNGAYFILKALESPLFQSGKLDTVLRPFQSPISSKVGTFSKIFFGILLLTGGGFLFFIVLRHILAREAVFTPQGWFRPSPFQFLQRFKRKKKPDLKDLGITHGDW